MAQKARSGLCHGNHPGSVADDERIARGRRIPARPAPASRQANDPRHSSQTILIAVNGLSEAGRSGTPPRPGDDRGQRGVVVRPHGAPARFQALPSCAVPAASPVIRANDYLVGKLDPIPERASTVRVSCQSDVTDALEGPVAQLAALACRRRFILSSWRPCQHRRRQGRASQRKTRYAAARNV